MGRRGVNRHHKWEEGLGNLARKQARVRAFERGKSEGNSPSKILQIRKEKATQWPNGGSRKSTRRGERDKILSPCLKCLKRLEQGLGDGKKEDEKKRQGYRRS